MAFLVKDELKTVSTLEIIDIITNSDDEIIEIIIEEIQHISLIELENKAFGTISYGCSSQGPLLGVSKNSLVRRLTRLFYQR